MSVPHTEFSQGAENGAGPIGGTIEPDNSNNNGEQGSAGAGEAQALRDWIVLVDDEGDAEYLQDIGVDAWPLARISHVCDRLHVSHGEVLLVGAAPYRVAQQVRDAGASMVWHAHVPIGHPCVESYLEHNAQVVEYRRGKSWLADLWKVRFEDRAMLLDLPAGPQRRRVRDWLDVAADPPVEWLVDGVIPAGGLVVVAGEPSAGKTLLVLDLALRAAHGMPWFNRQTRPIRTLYLPGEGGRGLGSRLRAWRSAHGAAAPAPNTYLRIGEGVPDLTRSTGIGEIEQMIADGKPDLVVADTLHSACPSADENDAAAVGTVLAALAQVRQRHGCAVVILHHLRKQQPGAASGGLSAVRGSGALVGAADVVLLANRKGDARQVEWAKCRDGELLPPVAYQVVGQDTDRAGERGPVVLPTGATGVADPEQERRDADRRDTERLLEALRSIEPADSIGAIVVKAGIKTKRGHDLFRLALAEERVKNAGSERRPRYQVCVARAPTPPMGTGRRTLPSSQGFRESEGSRGSRKTRRVAP